MSNRRIRDNEYDFPADRGISTVVQQLIQQILIPIPSERPTLLEIVDHLFFTQGPVPSYIPTSAYHSAPDFRHISKATSDTNLRRLRESALLDIDQRAKYCKEVLVSIRTVTATGSAIPEESDAMG